MFLTILAFKREQHNRAKLKLYQPITEQHNLTYLTEPWGKHIEADQAIQTQQGIDLDITN